MMAPAIIISDPFDKWLDYFDDYYKCRMAMGQMAFKKNEFGHDQPFTLAGEAREYWLWRAQVKSKKQT